MTKKLSNQKHQFPENLHLRKLHKDSLKNYKDKCNAKKCAYRQDKFDLIDKSLHDSEKMWKEFHKFSEIRAPRSTIDEKISASEWKTHYETLHSENGGASSSGDS